MALPAEDRSKQAQPPPEDTQEPATDRGKEARLEEVEQREVTLEVLEKEIEELVGQAESGRADFDATRDHVLERIRSYGGDLTPEERTKLEGLQARAESRVRDLKVKALDTRIAGIKAKSSETADGGRYSGPQAAILAQLESELATLKKEGAPAEAAAPDSEEIAALKRRIENIKRAQGESAGGEHYRGPQAAILKDLEAQLAAAQGKGKAAGAEPEIKFDEPVVEGAKEAAPTPPEGTPTVAPETAPPTPETEPARSLPSARELMAIAKIRAQLVDAPPEALRRAIERAKFTETKALLETGETKEPLIELVKTLGGLEGDQALRGPAIERLAAAIGVPAAAIEGALARQRAALEQRARDEVRRESQAGLKKVIAKGAAYVGLGAILNRFLPGWGALTAGVRMVETWRQGSVETQKVQEKLAAFQKQLEEGDLRDPKALVSELLRDLAADAASAKRAQIDGLQPAAGELADPRVMATAMHRDTLQFLQERYPNLTTEQRRDLARGAAALYMMDHANAKFEAQVAEQQPSGFRKLIATLDKVLGSKVLRGGETTREKMLTTVVFAAAGAMARELPIIRNILFAYTGFKAGEMLASGITRRAGRYEVLKPVSAAALAGETVEQGVMDRARAQLLDAGFRTKSPAEYQQLREAVERHELALLSKAESATAFVDGRTAAMEQTLAAKRTKEQERQLVVNSARIAGAAIGAVLGPMAVEWIAKKLHPESATAPPEAVAPVEPETDPRMDLVGTRQAGDGWTHIRARQFYALEHPELSGDQIVAKMEAHKQMLVELRAAHGFKYAANPRHWDERAFSLKYIELGKADAISNGVLAEDGRTTLVSLRGEGVLPIDPEGKLQPSPEGGLQFYATKAKFGFETTGPVAGKETITGDVRYLDAGDTAMSEDEYASWIKAHPDAAVAAVRPGGRAGTWIEMIKGGKRERVFVDEAVGAGAERGGGAARVIVETGGRSTAHTVPRADAFSDAVRSAERTANEMTGTVEGDLGTLRKFIEVPASASGGSVREAVAGAESHLQALREQVANMKGRGIDTADLDRTIGFQERALADAKRELTAARLFPAEAAAVAPARGGGAPAAEVAAAGAGGRTPEFAKAWEDVFRGDRPPSERIAQMTAYLRTHPVFKALGGRIQFKLEGSTPVYSTDAGATFVPVDDGAIRTLVAEQGKADALFPPEDFENG